MQQQWPEEKYKWEAVQCFQLNWDVNSADFAQMLTKALAKCSYERTDIERRTEAAMLKNKELADYIMDQLSELGDIRNIPMMGGYAFYYKERIFGGIYGNGFLVKITAASKKFMPDSKPEPPYEGAKPMLPVTILDDRTALQNMVDEMYSELPERKPKKKRV